MSLVGCYKDGGVINLTYSMLVLVMRLILWFGLGDKSLSDSRRRTRHDLLMVRVALDLMLSKTSSRYHSD